MIIQPIKKLWFGDDTHGQPKITLRSYWVKNVIRRNESVKVVYNDSYMILTPEELKSPVSTRTFKSKIGKEDYQLLDYIWIPKV